MLKPKPLLAGAASLALLTSTIGFAQGPEPSASSPDELGFSLSNMDRSVDPADDFYRYAAGGWLDRAERPADKAQYNFLTLITDRIDGRVKAIVADARERADQSPQGSPRQQVGTLYNAYMNVETLNAKGIAPIQPELDRISAITTMEGLAAYLGHYHRITGQWALVEIDVFEGLDDPSVNEIYFQPGAAGLTIAAIHEAPADSPLKKVYSDYIAGLLTIAGYEAEAAADIAATSMAIEAALHKGKLDPALKIDYRNMNNPRTIEKLRAELGAFPVDVYFDALGLGDPAGVIVAEPDYTGALAGVMEAYSIDQLKDYLAYRLIQRFGGFMQTEFEEPGNKVNIALLGTAPVANRENNGVTLVKSALFQPVGRLYIEQYFSEAEQEAGLDMVRRLQAAFRNRLESNEWLSDSTRQAAIEKVDKFYYRFGRTDKWLDFASVDITDDLVQSSMNLNKFHIGRKMQAAGKAPERYPFSSASHTAPIVVNAAYNASVNGFEVTAGIAQPPTFEADLDAPVYFCRLGAVIGHEMTHGFDSGGRAFDADGRMRDWWTPEDAAHFDKEATKLIEQANAYEILPGTFVNGAITVKENMADVGGITLAYDALQSYLAEHPEENVVIDGYTPTQRCFIAWAQLWAEKSSEQAIKVQLEDNHPPSPYRTYSPLQHLDAFYEAFDIVEGEPMWLAPENRVKAW